MPKYSEMTLEELDELRMALIEKRQAVADELHAVTKEYNWLYDKQRAEELLGNMNESQRAAILEVASTESTTKVGTPGTN